MSSADVESFVPGPWQMELRAGHSVAPRWVVFAENVDRICILSGRGGVVSSDQEKANACLVCAAPDLFAALESCLASLEMSLAMLPASDPSGLPAIASARLALARARGES